MVNVCTAYSLQCDICFNPLKSQCITFRCKRPLTSNVTLNHLVIYWANMLKYLGCYFAENNCKIVIRGRVRKFF